MQTVLLHSCTSHVPDGSMWGMQRSIIVPPELGYGSKGLQEIPPNSSFELQVEVLSVA
jgi:peptidylprolyl isomerase